MNAIMLVPKPDQPMKIYCVKSYSTGADMYNRAADKKIKGLIDNKDRAVLYDHGLPVHHP